MAKYFLIKNTPRLVIIFVFLQSNNKQSLYIDGRLLIFYAVHSIYVRYVIHAKREARAMNEYIMFLT